MMRRNTILFVLILIINGALYGCPTKTLKPSEDINIRDYHNSEEKTKALFKGNHNSTGANSEIEKKEVKEIDIEVESKQNIDIPTDYIIGPEDVIEVLVWKNQELSKVVTVRPDGKISLPLIGDVKAMGLTPNQLKEEISKKLSEYKEIPEVSVIIQQINSYVIYVLGEVNHPGRYQLKSSTTILQAITISGGFTQFASRKKIIIIRKDFEKGSETRIKINYEDIISGKDLNLNIDLKPGDTIVVP